MRRDLNFISPIRDLNCDLPYISKTSLDLRMRLRRAIEENLPYCEPKVIFTSKGRLISFNRVS